MLTVTETLRKQYGCLAEPLLSIHEGFLNSPHRDRHLGFPWVQMKKNRESEICHLCLCLGTGVVWASQGGYRFVYLNLVYL